MDQRIFKLKLHHVIMTDKCVTLVNVVIFGNASITGGKCTICPDVDDMIILLLTGAFYNRSMVQKLPVCAICRWVLMNISNSMVKGVIFHASHLLVIIKI